MRRGTLVISIPSETEELVKLCSENEYIEDDYPGLIRRLKASSLTSPTRVLLSEDEAEYLVDNLEQTSPIRKSLEAFITTLRSIG